MSYVPAAILGAAQSAFGRFPEATLQELAWEAVGTALELARIDPEQIDRVYVGNVFGPSGVASRVLRDCGITSVPVVRVEAACASGTLAAHMGVEAVRSGDARHVLALGIEQMSTQFDGAIIPEGTDPEGSMGLPLPGLYALQAQWYLEKYGHDAESLGLVAVKNRAAGALNSKAHRQSAISLEDVLASRMIAEPLTVLQCCPISDGAAAAVIGTPRREVADDVVVIGSGYASGAAWPGEDDEAWGPACVRRAAQIAETQAGVSATQADVIEVHDAFTIGEVLTVEALGLCRPGEAIELLKDGELGPDGRWSVNPGGGLLSRGHALGATGIAQLAEVCDQLTGRAGPRQVASATLGLVETMGGGASGLDGNAAGVMFLRAQG